MFAELRERDLELHHPSSENPVAINYFWLRDHCQCARCYAEDTSQRTINILQISLDIKPVFGEITNDNLHIKCKLGQNDSVSFKNIV